MTRALNPVVVDSSASGGVVRHPDGTEREFQSLCSEAWTDLERCVHDLYNRQWLIAADEEELEPVWVQPSPDCSGYWHQPCRWTYWIGPEQTIGKGHFADNANQAAKLLRLHYPLRRFERPDTAVQPDKPARPAVDVREYLLKARRDQSPSSF